MKTLSHDKLSAKHLLPTVPIPLLYPSYCALLGLLNALPYNTLAEAIFLYMCIHKSFHVENNLLN